ncbi:suppressor APC domain-containing protein 2-like [Babylonia areolata]|uniref:suppressor APC domain-containing protein 2-like n=1 Tax=Babylonia areolata TaxID=304850 RepID=UPI003FD2A7E2
MTTPTNLKAEVQDGLPRQFVASLKILFDILDEEHSGLIRLRDIETRWSDEGVKDLPSGVMEGLRKVAPPNGLLTFENFVSGLKLALFRGNDQMKRRSMSAGSGIQKENRSPTGSVPGTSVGAKHPSSPNQPLQTSPANRQQGFAASDVSGKPAAGAGKHRSAIPHHQQKSPTDARPATVAVKPQLSSGTVNSNRHPPPPPHNSSDQPHPSYPSSRFPPPRPERSLNPQVVQKSGSEINPPHVPPRDQRQNQKVVTETKNWQRDWVNSRGTVSPTVVRDRPPSSDDPQHAIYANIDQFQHRKTEEGGQAHAPGLQHAPGKATVRRHGSGRRHTLQNGVDQNMIKRMQQLEEEGEMLKRGLEMVEVARDWYLRQLAAVQDKQRMLGKVNHNDNSLEAHQERMNFQRARISEVNLQLRTLVDSSEKGFPLHMNLAVTPVANGSSSGTSDGTIHIVREQNRRLTQDVREKSDRITKLEQEKASLIRELFESRSKHKSNYDDTTFM